jgi:hypothetical protein
MCCDSACDGPCEACTAQDKGLGEDGVCASVVAGTDPRERCDEASGYPEDCGADGMCDGAGACREFAPRGVACGEASCLDNTAQGMLCNGVGQCVNSSVDCSPYLCVSGACTSSCTSDDDCAPGAFCDDNSTCQDGASDGEPCTESRRCAGGICRDGYCRDSACDEQCAACDVAGREGTCSPVQGEPHADRPACAGQGEECGGECNGSNTVECSYPPSGTACGTPSCEDGEAASFECDGAGACRESPAELCSPYVCGDMEYLTECESSDDCADGYACDTSDGECVPAGVHRSWHSRVGRRHPAGLYAFRLQQRRQGVLQDLHFHGAVRPGLPLHGQRRLRRARSGVHLGRRWRLRLPCGGRVALEWPWQPRVALGTGRVRLPPAQASAGSAERS